LGDLQGAPAPQLAARIIIAEANTVLGSAHDLNTSRAA
jgi:hypothetical protein